MSAYYNENDPKAALWLNYLVIEGHIPDGIVDERSIEDIHPEDLNEFTQCHFFAGIGGWAYALKLAGWPDDREVWTGSCPCQPFSAAGKGTGVDDERHLWPAFHWLITQCRPRVVFGEQVASKAGRAWLDLVSTDLEGEDYAFGACDLAAASIGAPHIRQRHFWMADSSNSDGRGGERGTQAGIGTNGERRLRPASSCPDGVRLGYSNDSRPQGRRISGDRTHQRSPWSPSLVDWVYCQDGKYRPVEPGTFPLAHGAPARVGRLRGYGNAIVPQVAKEVIGVYMEMFS